MPSTPKEVTDVLIDLLKSDCNWFVDKLGNYLHQKNAIINARKSAFRNNSEEPGHSNHS